jgi:putative hemolysin
MRFPFKGRYRVRLAETGDDVRAAQHLRHVTFIDGTGAVDRAAKLDTDRFDAACDHILIEEIKTSQLVCCFRLMPLESGAAIGKSYSAQFYDLAALREFPDRMVEMGRFCVHPDHRSGEVLRLAWSAMTRYVDAREIKLLIGCSSFHGIDADTYKDSFALLRDNHLAPNRWSPRRKAANIFEFARKLSLLRPDPKRAMRSMPPLLRGYLSMGGWVSDHAVIDHDMNTLHVFTGLEISRVPERISRALRRN